jgi:hypothetical protein
MAYQVISMLHKCLIAVKGGLAMSMRDSATALPDKKNQIRQI